MLLFLVQSLAAALCLSSLAHGATLTKVNDWGGTNPPKMQMYIYVPDKLPSNPAVITVPHPCGGNSQNTFQSQTPKLPSYADRLGIILIFPMTTASPYGFPNCWDNVTPAGLKRDGGSDNQGLVNQVKYVLQKYNADPTRVFATGGSSGGMITNVLLATYPDVFAGGGVFSGAPMSGGAQGIINGYPGFNGVRPKVQVWHGSADTAIDPKTFFQDMQYWSEALNIPFSRNVTGDPESQYTKMVYGDGTKLVGYYGQGVPHIVPFHDEVFLKFMGLM